MTGPSALFRNKTPPRPTIHRVEDVSHRKPYVIRCTCGWYAEPTIASEVERLWKQHKIDERDVEPH
jgi:hypothetical protein